MDAITTVGVDLAKEVIAVCGADRSGKTVFTRVFRREAFAAWAVRLPPSVFGLEACGAAHHWARWLTSHGHTPHLMAAELVSTIWSCSLACARCCGAPPTRPSSRSPRFASVPC